MHTESEAIRREEERKVPARGTESMERPGSEQRGLRPGERSRPETGAGE